MTTTKATSSRIDVYTRVTDHILAELERGVRPWLKPWSAEHLAGRITRPLRHNGMKYQGINVLLLWAVAEMKGYVSPYWVTFKQAQELGGHVKKGEHGSPVVYANSFKKTAQDEHGDEVENELYFLKEYTVFNVEQCEGLPEHYTKLVEVQPKENLQRMQQVDEFFSHTKAEIRHGGNLAYYALQADYVQLPPFETFVSAESYAATLSHEMTHWTRHPSRLNRDFGKKKWGDEGYAMEELVAELGAAFLGADLDITPEVMPEHASYLDSWLKVLKQDKRAIFTAASHASRAVEFLHSLQPQPVEG